MLDQDVFDRLSAETVAELPEFAQDPGIAPAGLRGDPDDELPDIFWGPWPAGPSWRGFRLRLRHVIAIHPVE